MIAENCPTRLAGHHDDCSKRGLDQNLAFDALNRLIEEENELGKSRFYEYDFAGNITELTDRNGLVRQFSYDNLQRRTQEVWLDGQNTVNTIDFAYDAASQLTSASDDFSG